MKSIDSNSTSRPTKLAPPARAKKPNLTPWFPASVKPARVGVYQISDYPTFQYWNGNYWCFLKRSVLAAYHSQWRSSFQNNRWRGLASNPARKS